MIKINYKILIVLAIVFWTVACTPLKKEVKQIKPNIILILADDAGYADFGFMGSDEIPTPHIDNLAKDGIIFTDAHVSATVCSPSRAGLLTGRYQQQFGHECNIPPHNLGMDITEVTIGDVMKSAGYKTAVFGKWHLGESAPFHPNKRGFDEFWGFLEGHRSYFYGSDNDIPGNPHEIQHNGKHVEFDGYLTDMLGEKTIDFIDQNKKNPFFVFLSFNAVHTPMQARKDVLDKFKDHPRKELAAMTWSMDEAVGKVVARLKAEGLYKNTLIFFLSDNGGAANNQSSCLPLKGWKGNKFEGGHRVPYLVVWPEKLEGGKRYDELTSALDIFATSMAAAGITEASGKPLDGVNLIPHLTGDNSSAPHNQLFWRKEGMAATRENNWKLIRLDNYGYRLYNLEDDLGETLDHSIENKEQFNKMVQSLEHWESNLTEPWWREAKDWNQVTFEIHKALMENREPNYKSPEEMKSYLNQ